MIEPAPPPLAPTRSVDLPPVGRIFLGFSTTDVFMSKVIRRVSGAAYSHAWLCHGHHIWGGAWVTQADWPTVHSWPYEVATAGWSRLMVYEVVGDLYGPMKSAMMRSRGLFEERFDLTGLLGMGLITMARKWTRRRFDNPLVHPNTLFCSEFVERVLQGTDLQPFVGWKPADSSPNQVYEACGRSKSHFRRVETREFADWLSEVGVRKAAIRENIIASRHEWAGAEHAREAAHR